MAFELKPTHPVKMPCCGGTKVDDIVYRERRAANFDRRPQPHHGFPGLIFF